MFACDESVLPAMRAVAEDFMRTYEKAVIVLRSVQGREGAAEFVNDTTSMIVMGRAFNKEERDALKARGTEYQSTAVARDAVAVIVHPSAPFRTMRVSMLDSIFSGSLTRWPGGGGVVEVYIGNVNSSTNEVFRAAVLDGRPFGLTAEPLSSDEAVVEKVASHPDAIGIAGLGWLRGRDAEVAVLGLGRPGVRADSTEPPGRFYTPHQAHVHRRYYPVTRPVVMHSKALLRDVGYGFISYAASHAGQQVFLNNGLVPVTMPVRLVELTSDEVDER